MYAPATDGSFSRRGPLTAVDVGQNVLVGAQKQAARAEREWNRDVLVLIAGETDDPKPADVLVVQFRVDRYRHLEGIGDLALSHA